jgi:peptidoglycan/LPS O-acetylase OafA/YrhL
MIAAWRKLDLRRIVIWGTGASLLTRFLLVHSGVPLGTVYSQTECRFDALLVGAMVALLWRDRWLPSYLPKVTAVAVVFLLWALEFAHPNSVWLYDGGFTAVAIASGVLVLACVNGVAGFGALTSRALRSCGRFSYSAYLWHPFVFLAVYQALPHDTLVRVSLGTVLLVTIAVSSTLFIEEPLRRLVASRRRTPRSPATAPLSPSVASA